MTTGVKVCKFELRQIGGAEHEVVEIQNRGAVPQLGDVVELRVSGKAMRAKVVNVQSLPPGDKYDFVIGVDEM